ncbi:hypothetical protein [Aurantimonas sp. Leaf443]|uniref:hypothetical protein n=1 Tax=Aurantimonas sp. Leaf443 TaxID=1736378 RepID=UPI0006F62993|nr:hypothetical protein [Aurantimonas sp. Leaf443]KQT83144.1 hypothetical protein ASG48_14345 [Aurantimonas sp. Leaf443]
MTIIDFPSRPKTGLDPVPASTVAGDGGGTWPVVEHRDLSRLISTWDNADIGMALLDEQLRVVAANVTGEDLLSTRSHFFPLTPGARLRPTQEEDAERLRLAADRLAFCAAAIQTLDLGASPHGLRLTLRRLGPIALDRLSRTGASRAARLPSARLLATLRAERAAEGERGVAALTA